MIGSYSATLLTSFGFTPQTAALLNMPSGAVQIGSALYAGLLSRHFGKRWIWISTTSLVGVAGAALLSFIPSSNRAGMLIQADRCEKEY